MSLQWIVRAGTLSLFILLAVGWRCIQRQQAQLAVLLENNTRLSQQVDILKAHASEMKKREANLSAALTTRQQTQQRLEEKHEQQRHRLRQAVVQAPCAAQPVPNDVIRLQRDALRDDNAVR